MLAYVGLPQNLKDLKDVIRKKAWSYYRTISGVRLCWELEGPKAPKKKDLKDSVCVRARSCGSTPTPQQSQPLCPLHEPLHWRAKRDPEAKMLSRPLVVLGGWAFSYRRGTPISHEISKESPFCFDLSRNTGITPRSAALKFSQPPQPQNAPF